MDGVTDQPFRQIAKKYGRADVIFTEFTSAEGISRNAIKLLRDFLYDESQRPIVAQIFGKEPAAFRATALILGYLGFDGIDINMGCPAKNVSHHGGGAALIRTPELAQEIVRAVQAGVQDWVDGKTLESCLGLKAKTRALIMERHRQLPEQYRQRRPLPVSVKTRIGFDEPEVERWIPKLLEVEPAAIELHARTLKQMYGGQADWSHIARAVDLAKGTGTLIIGNGDLQTAADVQRRVQETGVDGVLIGRATFGNPWVIADMVRQRNGEPPLPPPTLKDRISLAIEHSRLFEASYPDETFMAMRKHLAWYIKDFPNASDFRTALVLANSADEVETILRSIPV
jgi:nifR3 family TIM-barrel protein